MQKEWQEVKNLVEAEAVEAKAQEKTESEQVGGGSGDNAGSSASAGASAGAVSQETHKTQQILLDNLAKEHVRAYIKLLPEPTTMEGVELAVRESSVSTIHGQERRNVFMIALSVDSLGEVAGRGLHRRPPVESDVLRKLVHGAHRAEEVTASRRSLLFRFLLETLCLCMMGAGLRYTPCSWISGSPRTSCWAPLSTTMRWL